jgi:quercetin dioxygenase-like cupin family protein
MLSTKHPVLQQREQARTHPVMGGSIAVRLRADETGARLGMIENVVPPGFGNLPLHVHPDFDEAFYVLEGELTFRVEEDGAVRTFAAGPGDTVSIPRGVGHAFSVTSAGAARFLIVSTAAGIAAFFADAGEPIERPVLPNDAPPFDRERLQAAFVRHGLSPYSFPVDRRIVEHESTGSSSSTNG